jgi:hypothetical protein
MAGVIERAQADLAAGREWKARDRLVGALVVRADDELLGLLGDVYFAMGDLPGAGAVWFGSNRTGPEVDTAALAWRDRHGSDDLQLWLSLPPRVRKSCATPAVDALHAHAVEAGTERERNRRYLPLDAPRSNRRVEPGAVIAAVVALTTLSSLVVGFVTIVRWLLF